MSLGPDRTFGLRRFFWEGAVALILGVATSATAGPVTGVLANVEPGQVLIVFRGGQRLLEITVPPDKTYSIVLDPGGYNVRCPNGKIVRIQALNGLVKQNIAC